jgi:hypothetical protein
VVQTFSVRGAPGRNGIDCGKTRQIELFVIIQTRNNTRLAENMSHTCIMVFASQMIIIMIIK